MQVGELLVKYVEMRELRMHHDARAPLDPRSRLKALAARFPGSLREIDRLPLAVIDARIAALSREPITVEPWMEAMTRFHDSMRTVLSIKRALAGGGPDARERALSAHPEAAGWDLDRVAKPPRGRLSALAIERIAEAMGKAPDEVRALLFGPLV